MRQLSIATLAVLVSSLAGCAGPDHGGGRYGGPMSGRGPERPPPVSVGTSTQQDNPLARSVTYACEGATTVVVVEGERAARVTLNSGQELTLARTGPGGTHFGAPPYEFRTMGGEGVFSTQDRAWRCRAK